MSQSRYFEIIEVATFCSFVLILSAEFIIFATIYSKKACYTTIFFFQTIFRVFQIIPDTNLPLSESTSKRNNARAWSTNIAVSEAQASLCRNLAYGRFAPADIRKTRNFPIKHILIV